MINEMRDNNNFNGPNTELDQRLGINERPIDLLSYNAGLYRAMNKKAGSDAQEKDNPEPGPGDDKNWFYIEDVSGLGNTLILTYTVDPEILEQAITSYDFYVSKDKNTWTKLDTLSNTYHTVMYEFGECEKVYLRCNCLLTGFSDAWYVNINCINSYNIGGNIMSLLYGSDFTGNETILPEYSITYEGNHTGGGFSQLFNGSETLRSAENLVLPALELQDYCYAHMFFNCTSLIASPQLPATNLTNHCYSAMFSGCKLLTTAPQLPATTLAEYCYSSMFSKCASLIEAPQLPATSFAKLCYESMFSSCVLLTSIIIYIEGEWTADADYWVEGIDSEGTLYNLGRATGIPKPSKSGCPEGWAIETELPQE